MSRVPSPSLDACLGELLCEEQWLVAQATLAQTAPRGPMNIAYTTKGQSQARDMKKIRCYKCQKFGHFSTDCNPKFCNYCEGTCHVISECRKRP